MYRLTAVLAAALVFASSTTAATAPIRWTPKRMTAALIALQYPHPGTFSGVCAGRSKAIRGTYTSFRCTMTWQTDGPPLASGKITVWAKPMPAGRVCGSTASVAACRPLAKGPLANDPTVCSVPDPTGCAEAASERAIVAKHGPGVANLVCTQGQTVYVWSCHSLQGSYTVMWSKGVGQWVVTVTP